MMTSSHKAGFVNIIGKPNVGKSTLMNALLGEKLSITTAKAQTTQHLITGISNGSNFQIIYTDTPGVMTPKYALQQSMMQVVRRSLGDADVLLWVVDIYDDQEVPVDFRTKLLHQTVPIFLLINKVDLIEQTALTQLMNYWADHIAVTAIIPVSALQAYNLPLVLKHVLACLPQHPPYYPADMLTDKSERFFAAEIIREKILNNYHQEIPYSVSITIETFKEEAHLIKMRAVINTERKSQKSILIGNSGRALKKVGIEARHDLERFFRKKVFLEQHVKVVPDWRTKSHFLRQFGYT